MYRAGGWIASLGRWKTVPPAAFHRVDFQPVEGVMDVFRGDIFSGTTGLSGVGNERSGSLAGDQRASGHGARDAGQCYDPRLLMDESSSMG